MSYNTVIKFIQFEVKLNPISRLKISLLINSIIFYITSSLSSYFSHLSFLFPLTIQKVMC